MSSDLNRVILVGRLTRDPELRYTPSGTAVASFAIANNKSYSQGGEKKEQVGYFDVVAWGKLAEIMTEHVKKGQQLAIEGRLTQRRWKDADGNNKSKIEIVVDTFQFLGGKKEGESAPSGQGKPESAGTDVTGQGHGWEDATPFSDDDIPF